MHSEIPQLEPPLGHLPLELFFLIIESFVAHLPIEPVNGTNSGDDPGVPPSTIREILNLRFVCKAWAKAVPKFVFRSLRLRTPRIVESLMENWKDSILDSEFSPAKRLHILGLEYVPSEELENDQQELVHDEDDPPISMEQATRLIQFLGRNLTSLTIRFVASMGFSPEMIEAVKEIKCLKKLQISIRGDPGNYYNINSLAELLNVTPHLESLTIESERLEILNLQPQALPKLKHLWFSYHPDNIQAISQLCKATRKTLKVIEYLYNDDDDLGIAIEPLQETLESLFIQHLPRGIPKDVRNLTFPKLRVVRGFFWFLQGADPVEHLEWLQRPILQNVRTLIMDPRWGKDYWRTALEHLGEGTLVKPRDLKHFIFTYRVPGSTEDDEPLIRALNSHGIQCHFMPDPTYDQILAMEWDTEFKLNGPTN